MWPSKTRLLRFIVFSSGDGTLKATLGSTWLGSAGLHAGNNDMRYVLPTRLLKSLRKTNTPGERPLAHELFNGRHARRERHPSRRHEARGPKPKKRRG